MQKNKIRAKTGSIGEEIVVFYEKNYLRSINRNDLIDKVKRISLEDTYAGYDVLSFDKNGKEKRIEVKATPLKRNSSVIFNLTKNEKEIAENSENYLIYLVFDINSNTPEICIFNLKDNESLFSIVPTQFLIKGDFAETQ